MATVSLLTGSVLERMRERTRQAREEMATQLFGHEAEEAAMSAAAAAGRSRTIIVPEKPCDLSKTAAAAELVAWLEKESFRVEWEKRSRPEQDASMALMIEWPMPETPGV